MKLIITTLILGLTSLAAISDEVINVPDVSNLDEQPVGKNVINIVNPSKITKEDIIDAKNTVIDNKDALLDMGASIYSLASYVVPFDGAEPDGFGAGIGVDLPLAYNIEAQVRVYWTDDRTNGSTWLADAGLGYRYRLPSEPVPIDVYARGFVGYKGTPDADIYSGFGLGFQAPISERSTILFEPAVLFGFDGQHVMQFVGGFSWEF